MSPVRNFAAVFFSDIDLHVNIELSRRTAGEGRVFPFPTSHTLHSQSSFLYVVVASFACFFYCEILYKVAKLFPIFPSSHQLGCNIFCLLFSHLLQLLLRSQPLSPAPHTAKTHVMRDQFIITPGAASRTACHRDQS